MPIVLKSVKVVMYSSLLLTSQSSVKLFTALRWRHITLFLEDCFSFTSKLRLWSTKTAPLFFLCTALRATFQVELWFLNPVWRTRKKIAV